MELPADKEDDEEMMGVPELLIALLLPLLDRVPDHDTQGSRHDPSRQSWARREVDGEEGDEFASERRRCRVGEKRKVDHMADDTVNVILSDREDEGEKDRLTGRR